MSFRYISFSRSRQNTNKNQITTNKASKSWIITFYSFQSDVQGPLNRQIIKSGETIKFGIELFKGIATTFLGLTADVNNVIKEQNNNHINNDLGQTDDRPRYNDQGLANPETLGQVFQFAKTLYNLM